MKIDMFSALFKKTYDPIHNFSTRFKTPLRFKIPFIKVFLVTLGLSISIVPCLHAFTLTVSQTPGGPGKDYTLSWTAPTKSTTSAKTYFFIYSEFGRDTVDFPLVPPFASGPTFIGSVIDQTTIRFSTAVGTRGFIVISTDSIDPAFNDISNTVYHSFIHASQDNGGAIISMTDGDGTLRGVDQIWKFSFYMDDDAYVSMKIFGPGTTFSFDANGFATGAASGASPIKVILSTETRRARPGERGGGSVQATNNDDVWDSKTSTGSIVPNGIYYLLVQPLLDAGQNDFSTSALRQGSVFTIPVDILRLLNVRTTGITLTNPTATISYFLTGDALVRMVIARPGSTFAIDSNGDIQPRNSSGVIDTSLIVSTRTFQRKAGNNSETWDGTSSTGAVMASGVYPVGFSARDEYGNRALDASGRDNPIIFGNITLERTAGSSGGTGTTDTTPPSIKSITPTSGSTVNTGVSTVTIVLQDTGGSTVNLAGSNVTMRDPTGTNVTFTRTNSGSDTIILTFASPLRTNGTYTLALTAVDTAGNSANLSATFTVDVRLEEGSFKNSFVMFPNPAKNVTSASIRYDLSVDATVKMEVFNILGERVYDETFSDTQNTGITHTWNLSNSSGEKVASGVYLIRLKASGSGSNVEAVKKLVVVQ